MGLKTFPLLPDFIINFEFYEVKDEGEKILLGKDESLEIG